MGHSGADERSALVEIDGALVGDQIWPIREEVRVSHFAQAPGRHPAGLRIGVVQGGDHGGSDVSEVVAGQCAEPPDCAEGPSPEMLEILLFQADEERCDDRDVVGVQGGATPQDLRHGLRGSPADSAGLVVDEPPEAAEEFANVTGIVRRNAGSGRSYGLDRAPADPWVCGIGQRDEAAEHTLPSRRHFGDFVEAPLVEEFV